MKEISVIDQACVYIPGFLSRDEGIALFNQLECSVIWNQEVITLFGRARKSPRLTAWYSDPGAVYRYAGVTHHPNQWPAFLSAIRQNIHVYTGETFNILLLNYYHDGNDGMGKHSDDEKELGNAPVIASLSLGGTRRFLLHPRHQPDSGKSIPLDLGNGSLLIMKGDCQANWKHSLPKTRKQVEPRINLTFRRIVEKPG